MTVVVIVAVIVVMAVLIGFSLRRRATSDGVDSFRRQIDALSPEARKPTVERVKSAERPETDKVVDAADDADGAPDRNGDDAS